jgi:hypothetical protein
LSFNTYVPEFFTNEAIRAHLRKYGYTSNPDGLAQAFPVDFVFETEGAAYLDINADAVRKGDEVPDRPVRVMFRKITDGPTTRWELESVEELAVGVETKCLDRHPDTPKISPWPHKKNLE